MTEDEERAAQEVTPDETMRCWMANQEQKYISLLDIVQRLRARVEVLEKENGHK